MRPPRSLTPVTAAAVLVLALPGGIARAGDGKPHAPDRFGASCRTKVDGSEVVAHCHNPYVHPDRVRLHIECARWWDIDTDSAPVAAGPAMTVKLAGRCWKEIRVVWISHQKAG
ncbi:hypothetical protein [Streptomyces sp. NPDC046860]|uniref:hypothetical protein n=1 Tax=Streptomyces sp. NPDC046860 TaxID=3154495 RepID=UPI0033D7B1EC